MAKKGKEKETEEKGHSPSREEKMQKLQLSYSHPPESVLGMRARARNEEDERRYNEKFEKNYPHDH